MTKIEPMEKTRTYHFPGGDKIRLENVSEVVVRPSGNHRLKTEDGKLHIVTPGWIHIEIEAESWTF